MTDNINEILNYSSKLTLLYVEDDKEIREQMIEVLQDIFQLVIVAEDGQEGLVKYNRHKKEFHSYPDLVLTDIRMPHLDGIEMSKKILSLYPSQIIIITSAHNESKFLLEIINMGISHFLIKPIESKQFHQTLHKASKRHFYEKMELVHQKEMERLANEDPLTGISNRRYFFKKANRLFEKSKMLNVPFTVFAIDLDKFKDINDTYGHHIGDEVIKLFVNIVSSEVKENDCFARFGGDEFVVIMQMTKEKSLPRMNKIQESIEKTHALLDTTVNFTVSIGMTEVNYLDKDIDTVIRRADINLYKEKRSKRQYPRNQCWNE